MENKLDVLKEYLKGLGSVAVAFSGGVDSTFLLKVSHDVLGNNAAAVTIRSCTFPEREFKEAQDFCEKEGIKQIVIDSNELEIEGFSHNPKNRCYLCKSNMLSKALKAAGENDLKYVAEGSNMDDNGDYRPGLQAVKELGVKSPLREAGLTKEEIRQYSKAMGLKTWDKPSFACLSSRFVYGEEITEEKLSMVDKAEQFLYEMGFGQFRVRLHGNMARIEVLPEDIEKIAAEETRSEIVKRFKELGFSYITLDLKGYRSGSMNETLQR